MTKDFCLLCNTSFGTSEKKINNRHLTCNVEYLVIDEIKTIAKMIKKKVRWLRQTKAIIKALNFESAREGIKKMMRRIKRLKASARKKFLEKVGNLIERLMLLAKLKIHLEPA